MRKHKRMWELRQSADFPNTAELYIYGDVEGDEESFWTGETEKSETSAQSFREEFEKLGDVDEIRLYINSYGGSVYEGTAIYNQLRRHPAHITAYIDGFACSIASVIAMAADKVIMPKNAMMMIHNAWTWACGNAAELRKAAEDLDQINSGGMQAYLVKCGDKITEAELAEMLDRETWLTAEQCIKYGFADEYAEKEVDMSKSVQMLKNANLEFNKRIELQKNLAACLRELKRDAEASGNTPAPTPGAQETNQTIDFLSALAQMGEK